VSVLKCREELIAEKVGRERDHDVLSTELQLLRSQTSRDETSRHQMNTEISRLREQLGEYHSSYILVTLWS